MRRPRGLYPTCRRSLFNPSITIKSGQCHVQKYVPALLDRILKREIDPTFGALDRAPEASFLDGASATTGSMAIRARSHAVRRCLRPGGRTPAQRPLPVRSAGGFIVGIEGPAAGSRAESACEHAHPEQMSERVLFLPRPRPEASSRIAQPRRSCPRCFRAAADPDAAIPASAANYGVRFFTAAWRTASTSATIEELRKKPVGAIARKQNIAA
jgi:hypothetical protein